MKHDIVSGKSMAALGCRYITIQYILKVKPPATTISMSTVRSWVARSLVG